MPSEALQAYRELQESRASEDIGSQILFELTKSYGLRRDEKSGEWSWSFENIAKSYEEDPFFTVVDWLTTLPVAVWGKAAVGVMRGSTAAGRGYQLYRGTKGAKGLPFGEAVKIQRRLGPRTAAGRFFSSRLGGQYDEDTLSALRRFPEGGAPEERVANATSLEEAWVALNTPPHLDRPDALWIGDQLRREERARIVTLQEQYDGYMRLYRRAKLTPQQEQVFHGLMGVDRKRFPEAFAAWEAKLGEDGVRLFEKSWEFRNTLHDEGLANHLFSPKTHAEHLGKWRPRSYEEYTQPGLARLSATRGERHFLPRRQEPFQHLREIRDPQVMISEMFQAAATVERQKLLVSFLDSPMLSKTRQQVIQHFGSEEAAVAAGWLKANHQGRRLLPSSRVAGKPSAELKSLKKEQNRLHRQHREVQADIEAVRQRGEKAIQGADARLRSTTARKAESEWRLGRPRYFQPGRGRGIATRRGRAASMRPEVPAGVAKTETTLPLERLRATAATQQAERGRTETLADFVRSRLDRRSEQIGRRMRRLDQRVARLEEREARNAYLRNLPDELADRFLDPAVAEDLSGYLKTHSQHRNLFEKLYYGMQTVFKKAHVPYNPGTIARNMMGGIMFHSFAVGMRNGIKLFPGKGRRALRGAHGYAEQIGRARSRGVFAYEPDREIHELLDKALGEDADRIGLPQLMGRIFRSDELSNWLRAQDDRIVRFYSAIDEWWKADAYLALESRYVRRGMSIEKAADTAARDVFRYFPNYGEGSPLMKMARPHLPFVSFPLEAIRVWKNVMVFRPHRGLIWNHMAQFGTQASAAAVGLSPGELETARESLPWYTKTKRMMMLPWRDGDGKLHFLDLSYIIPGAEIGSEAQLAESMLFGKIPLPTSITDLTANPVASIAAAAALGEDPFSGRRIEPRFTERYLRPAIGLPAPVSEGTRKFIGMGEYLAGLFLPPIVPPAYVGTNFVELVTGRKSHVTGEEYEEDAIRTILSNVAGLRTYEPTVEAQIANIKHDQRVSGERMRHAWDRWESAMANGEVELAIEEQRRIIDMRNQQRGDGYRYFRERSKAHMPGTFRNMSKREVNEVIRRSLKFGARPDELWPIYRRSMEFR